MPKYYIDSLNGSDSAAGTSESTPWRTYAKTVSAGVWVPGNEILLRRGREFTEYWIANGSGTDISGGAIRIGNYGSDDSLPVLRAQGTNQGISLLSHTGIIVDGLEVHGGNNGIDWTLHAGSTIPIIIRNCRVRAVNTGIIVYLGGGAGGLPGVIIENNTVFDCGAHGIQAKNGLRGLKIRGNTVRGCGRTAATHGISLTPPVYTGALTWTLTAGNVYQATITGATHTPLLPTTTFIDGVYFIFPSSRYKLLRDDVSAPASLATGRYQFSGGVLYVNCGVTNPTTATYSEIIYGGLRDWEITDNKVTDQFRFGGAEGAAIQPDDRASDGIIARNRCENTTGATPIYVNGGANVQVVANVLESSSGTAIQLENYANTCDISHNTIIVNANDGGSAIVMTGSNAGGTRKANSNIITGITTYAISDYFGSGAVYEMDRNCMQGHGSLTNAGGNLTGGNFTNTVLADPQLRGDYTPLAAAARSSGIASGRGDFYGKEFRGTIGAVQYQPARSVATRSLRAKMAVSV